MKTTFVLLTALMLCSCGYKMVGWSDEIYQTITIKPVTGTENQTRRMGVRLRDALVQSTLAGSALKPVERDGQLTLETTLAEYREDVVATDLDGRTLRLQYSIRASFTLKNQQGAVVWSLNNYQYSDQYNIATGRDDYRNEAVFSQDNALEDIADLVVANITLALDELRTEPVTEDPNKDDGP